MGLTGIVEGVPAAEYHADPAPEPSLSSSLACTLLARSPRHAWTAHPRLNPDFAADEKRPDRAMEIGTAAHRLILGAGQELVVVDGDDYRAKAAQAARAEAYAAGSVPILATDLAVAEAMAAAAQDQLAAAGLPTLFAEGAAEVVLIWRDAAGPWCRAMTDWLALGDGAATIVDVKTSATAVAPAGLGWKVADMGYETRAAFYARGLAHLRPDLAGRIRFLHLWIEQVPPYGLVVSELDGTAREIGNRQAAAAIGIWHACLSRGTAREFWPGYPPGIHRVEYPPRAESAWLEREMTDRAVNAAITADPVIGAVPPDRPTPPAAELMRV